MPGDYRTYAECPQRPDAGVFLQATPGKVFIASIRVLYAVSRSVHADLFSSCDDGHRVGGELPFIECRKIAGSVQTYYDLQGTPIYGRLQYV